MSSLDAIPGGSVPPIESFMQRRSSVRSLPESREFAESPQRVREAAEGFEEVLLQKLLDEMQKTIPDGELFDSSATTQVQSLFNMMMAKHIATSGGIGLADEMYREFSKVATIAPDATDGMELER